MFRARYFFITFFLLLTTSIFFPKISYAGSCLCNGLQVVSFGGARMGSSVRTPVENFCYNQDPAKIIAQADCEKISKERWLTPSSVSCTYIESETCDGVLLCNDKPCYQIEETCAAKSQCKKFVSIDNNAYGPASDVFDCKSGQCYVGYTSYQRYQNTPSLLGIKADLQLKQPLFEIRIPGLKFTDLGQAIDSEGYLHIPYIGEFISLIYKLAMGVGSIIAVVMLILEGVKIVVSGGGEMKTEAYGRIGQIVIGLIILWGSYAILYNLNPDLVSFKALKVKYIEPRALPPENDSITGTYPTYVSQPPWKTGEEFDANPNYAKTPAGVVPPSEVTTYKCPFIDNQITTIPEMKNPLCKVAELANKDGYTLHVSPDGGSYRSFEQQVKGWQSDKRTPAQKKSFRAVPGYSNHGHGRAIDVFLVDQNGTQLFSNDSAKQCAVNPVLISKLANYFYTADSNFNRLDTEIWHFEYGTTGQDKRSKITTKATTCN